MLEWIFVWVVGKLVFEWVGSARSCEQVCLSKLQASQYESHWKIASSHPSNWVPRSKSASHVEHHWLINQPNEASAVTFAYVILFNTY